VQRSNRSIRLNPVSNPLKSRLKKISYSSIPFPLPGTSIAISNASMFVSCLVHA
jgi:hypothetical protein